MSEHNQTADIQSLQETVAHQEQQINDLSDMLVAQGHEIDTLRKEIMKLQGKIENGGEEAQPADQRPPHY